MTTFCPRFTVVTPGPTFPIIYNKVDYSDKTLPVEFNNYQKYDNILIDDNKQDKPEEYNLINNDTSKYSSDLTKYLDLNFDF